MGWSLGFDSNWQRDIGYGVPSFCDHPDCNKVIDRGLSYVCGGEPYGGEHGCGLFFCGEHKYFATKRDWHGFLCDRCQKSRKPFKPSLDHWSWIHHKETDPSWAEWREEQIGKGLTQEEFKRALEAFDHLHSAIQYLAHSWGIDTPPEQMTVNLQARSVLIKLETMIVTQGESRLGAATA